MTSPLHCAWVNKVTVEMQYSLQAHNEMYNLALNTHTHTTICLESHYYSLLRYYSLTTHNLMGKQQYEYNSHLVLGLIIFALIKVHSGLHPSEG